MRSCPRARAPGSGSTWYTTPGSGSQSALANVARAPFRSSPAVRLGQRALGSAGLRRSSYLAAQDAPGITHHPARPVSRWVAGVAAAAQDLAARSSSALRSLRLRQLPLAVFMVALTATTLWSLGQSIVAVKPGV